MRFVYDDGGRSKYFSASNVGDCVTRAIANATGKDYKEVYDALNSLARKERTGTRKRKVSNSRSGVFKYSYKKYIEEELGWVWVPCMQIGSGCKVHLSEDELPKGTIIINVSKHLTCMKDGVLYDTYDCSRGGDRCVYGYWREPTQEERAIHEKSKSQVAEYRAFLEEQKRDLAKRKAEAKRHNDAIKKKYQPRIRKLKAQIAKLEREMQSHMMEMPTLERDAWAKRGIR